MKKSLLTILTIGLALGLLTGCGSKSSSATLKSIYKDYFKIGAAVNQTTRNNKVVSEFSSLTAENDMKWEAVHPTLEGYDYSEADAYIEIAKKNKMGVRGHALVWHQALPNYVFKDAEGNDRTKEEVLEIERQHVRNVITHFDDSIYCWDVCNEVIDDNPATALKEDLSNVYRESTWYTTCGSDFVKEAFKEADKTLKELGIRDKVQLIYNDYGNAAPVKKEKTIAMINELLEDNVPIDGIGLQSHYHLGSFDMAQLEQAIIDYSALGLDVQITEFDVEIYDTSITEYETQDFKKFADVPQENINMQATIYDRAFEIFRRHKDKISSVTFWGTSDASCYMNVIDMAGGNQGFGYHTNYPFLFDKQYKKKICYYAVAEFGKKLNKTYNPYKEVTSNNTYDGDGEDFYIKKFTTSNMQIVSRPVPQDDGSYYVDYTNVEGYDYISTSVSGRLSDFTYINILAKGMPGKTLSMRLFHSKTEDENHNLLGNDVAFTLEENEFTIHTLRIKGIYRCRMDLLTKVAIYPDLGIAGSYGDFYFKDIWFSNEIPEGSVLENPGVDTGDTSKTVNGWYYEAWTGYTLYKEGEGTVVSYVEAKGYGFISHELEINSEEDNAVRFSFENCIEFDRQTVSHIRFIIRGDVIGQGVNEEGYEYDIFAGDEVGLYTYNIQNSEHVEPDENNITTLEFSITPALNAIGTNHENGYRLTVMIESYDPDRDVFDASRDGKMIIKECEVFHQDVKPEYYSQTEDAFQYTLNDKEGVDKNITYENVPGNKYWPVIYRAVSSTHDQEIVIEIRNNGNAAVMVAVNAGILNDPRADEKNHMFYPLYMANKGQKNADGYYEDGERVSIAAGATYTFTVSVDDEGMYANDAISTLEFLIDNCRWEDNPGVTHSGDVDIVSVTVQDKE